MSRSSHTIIRNPMADKQRILALNNIFDLQGHQRTLGNWIARIEEFSGFLAELIISHNILHSSTWTNIGERLRIINTFNFEEVKESDGNYILHFCWHKHHRILTKITLTQMLEELNPIPETYIGSYNDVYRTKTFLVPFCSIIFREKFERIQNIT